jgi:glycosyltransferase involved in cell wall biosynthesis
MTRALSTHTTRVLLTHATRVLLTTDAVGGVWRYSLELAHGFARRGAHVSLAVLGPDPTAAQRAEAAAIPNLTLHPTGQPLDWTAGTPAALDAAAEHVARLAAQAGVDTVQLHTPALMGSARWPAPVIAAAHSCVATWWRAVRQGPLPADLAWRAAAVARGLATADAVLVPSASFAAALRACYPLERDIHVIPNGRRMLNGSARRRAVALTVGRLWDEGKDIATLDAAAALMRQPVHAAGPLSGPNGAQSRFRHLHWLGTLDEAALAETYAGAAVFASVARYEPFGLAVLEAAQAGCALVLSDIPTFRELWDGAATFVPPGKPDILARTLDRLLGDPLSWRRLGALAEARARAFDPERMAAATWDLHAAVLSRKAA